MTKVCQRCGKPVEDEDRYCSCCGRPQNFKPLPLWRRTWWRVLIIGLILYGILAHLLASSGNPNLVPTVILLGAFLVPVTYVIYLYESGALYDVPISTMALTFFWGGILGVIASQFLEENLVAGFGFLSLLAVGFSEELAKPLGVLWLIRRHEYADELHGLVLGGAAGMGFAALESMGYGFTYLLLSHGNLDILGQVLLTRGLLSPLAHGTWTAIVVGSIWRERMRGHFWLNRRSLGGFATAVILHTLWDWTASALPIDLVLPGVEFRWRFVDFMIPAIGLPIPGLIIGAIGIWILVRMFRESEQVLVTATT
ncbi:MAG TPA: PrsW family glutamic-type intramembrane protease [Chloroflexota bacterium]|nr:PrsW family glutamic-type intramembrane protease [Chloroflexota bacterium]